MGLTNFTRLDVGATSSNGTFNIVREYPWKLTGDVSEVPWIHLTEYELSFGDIVAKANKLKETVEQAVEAAAAVAGIQETSSDPYAAMYAGTPTGANYVFPYLKNSGSIRGSVRNQWGEDASAGSVLLQAAEDLGKKVGNNISPGYGSEPLQKFKGTSPRTITIEFPLYNTISHEKSLKNYEFVTAFTFQNLKTRTSYLTYIPPKVYKVATWSQGGIYMPLAYVDTLDVSSIGTLRNLYTDSGSIWLPEAYRVSISLTELIPQSSNIMLGEANHSYVDVIQTKPN